MQVDLTRLQQQKWKNELVSENQEADDEAQGGQPQPSKKGRKPKKGKKPGRRPKKGKKPGRKPKKDKKPAKKTSKKKSQASRKDNDKEKADVEGLRTPEPKTKPPAETSRSKKRRVQSQAQASSRPLGQQETLEADVVEPGRKRLRRMTHIEPEHELKEKMVESTSEVTQEKSSKEPKSESKTKSTFARRYKPKTKDGAFKWQALSAAFTAIVAKQLPCPSKLEAGIWLVVEILRSFFNFL